ncbi:MAG: hypothetical protein QHH01_01210 [Spirochaetales bacterium]|nr:hypothetical protein [Spirochaetales bacterium]
MGGFLYIHLSIMTTASVAMLCAIAIARYGKQRKWWLKAHKALNGIAAGLVIAGAIAGFFMVRSFGGPHLAVPHAWLGALVIMLTLCMPILGYAIFKTSNRNSIPTLKRVHRWLGRITMLLMVLTVLIGYRHAGFL